MRCIGVSNNMDNNVNQYNQNLVQGNNINNESYFDGGLLQLIGWKILGFIVTIITLGIYGFWVGIKLKKWQTKHLHFIQ